MMRYARGTLGPAPAEEAMPTHDLETGGESAQLEGEADLPETAPTEKSGKDMDQKLKHRSFGRTRGIVQNDRGHALPTTAA